MTPHAESEETARALPCPKCGTEHLCLSCQEAHRIRLMRLRTNDPRGELRWCSMCGERYIGVGQTCDDCWSVLL